MNSQNNNNIPDAAELTTHRCTHFLEVKGTDKLKTAFKVYNRETKKAVSDDDRTVRVEGDVYKMRCGNRSKLVNEAGDHVCNKHTDDKIAAARKKNSDKKTSVPCTGTNKDTGEPCKLKVKKYNSKETARCHHHQDQDSDDEDIELTPAQKAMLKEKESGKKSSGKKTMTIKPDATVKEARNCTGLAKGGKSFCTLTSTKLYSIPEKEWFEARDTDETFVLEEDDPSLEPRCHHHVPGLEKEKKSSTGRKTTDRKKRTVTPKAAVKPQKKTQTKKGKKAQKKVESDDEVSDAEEEIKVSPKKTTKSKKVVVVESDSDDSDDSSDDSSD